jgi:hypothetical protein
MMKKMYFPIVLFGALLFCACEKENIDPLVEDQHQPQIEQSALKGANSNGMTKVAGRLPMWARMASGAPNVIPTTNDQKYGVIVFYVTDPSIIPEDRNFYPGNWLAPQIFFLEEQFIPYENWNWFLPDYEVPHHYHLTGNGDVIIWIITFEQVLQLLANESITIPELEALDPLVGYATSYHEVLRPYGGGAPVLGGEFNASGMLEDGRKFLYTCKTKVKSGEPLISNCKLQIIDK